MRPWLLEFSEDNAKPSMESGLRISTRTVLTTIFQANLGKPLATSVALTGTGRWDCRKVLQPQQLPDALPVAQITASKH